MFSHPPSFRRLVTTFKPSSLCCGGFSSQHSMLRYHSSIQTHANYYTNMIQLQQEQEAFNPFEGKTEGLKKIDFVHVLPSDVVKNKRELLVEDMIAVNEKNVNSNFYKDHLRKAALNWRKEIKKLRRVDLGPFASATFENYDINWM
ncbi:hypothetical protein C9374_001648 [Naegleria lovaniensis]|uniref:Uncharacterized protein n=1 Tax=Naegleria lovaniensis TaxID=51637 RepID=A0AA88GRZ0_NAELO|nr:uncharacterized protein C9374_001648 [Naegleria lovaniensis]KAG2387316.1 hypothetical protein C9374_001648 [Naegleria lovaniensis]